MMPTAFSPAGRPLPPAAPGGCPRPAARRNPVAVKLGPGISAEEAVALTERPDPGRQPGRLTFITRFGADQIRDRLPAIVEKVTIAGAPVLRPRDPMHGNTFTAPSGHKTRDFNDVVDEVRGFLDVHTACDPAAQSQPGPGARRPRRRSVPRSNLTGFPV